MFIFAAFVSMLSSGMMHLIRALRFVYPSSPEVAMALWGATAVISASMAAFLVVYLPFLSALDLEVFPFGETASVGTLLNTKLAEEEERSVRIVSELIARQRMRRTRYVLLRRAKKNCFYSSAARDGGPGCERKRSNADDDTKYHSDGGL